MSNKLLRGLTFYKDLFDAREFNDPEGVAHLAYVLETEKDLEFNPYSIDEEFNQALGVYGLKIDGISYGIHPILNTLFTFTSENLIN